MSGGRVSFIVGGVQKAGTSALFEYLREVPALQLPSIKEAHFFDDESIDWSAPDYARYHALFESDGRLWGEATPIYLYWPNALERIRTYAPGMRLIFLFRDPVERAWSQWRMEYARGKEREPFSWCIREGRERMAGNTPYPGFDPIWSYVERGFYGTQLGRLRALFAPEQVLLLPTTALQHDPDATIAAICRFLQVPPPARPLVRRTVRPAPHISYPSKLTTEDSDYLRALYAEEIERFHARGGPLLE